MRRLASLLFITLLVTACSALAQDVEYIRAVERAQQQRPGNLTTAARIAPESEPGTPLIIRGHAFAEDGTRPLANAIVFAYQTDRTGVYDVPGNGPHSWRLKGWARTDAQGAFEFRTIRPGSYPNSNNPAHVHFTIFTADGQRYHAGEARFADDALNSAAQKSDSQREGKFGEIREVRTEGSAQVIDLNLRVAARGKF